MLRMLFTFAFTFTVLHIKSVFVFQERTRSALLETLYEELHVNSQSMMGLCGDDDKLENGGGGGGGFFESFKVVCLNLLQQIKTGLDQGYYSFALVFTIISNLL